MTHEKGANIERLEREGWTKQFVAGEPRLSEAVEIYKDLGFEVHLEPLPKQSECETCVGPEEEQGECRICFDGFEDQYKIIFTRPLKGRPESDNGFF
jgi:hypothetical protein